MSEKRKTETHTEVDLGWSLILTSMTGGHPPLLSYLKNPQTQIIIRKSWSSVCRKSCLSTFSSYPSVPKQMDKLFWSVVWPCCFIALLWFRARSSTKWFPDFEATFYPHETMVPKKEHKEVHGCSAMQRSDKSMLSFCFCVMPSLYFVSLPSYVLSSSFQPMHFAG